MKTFILFFITIFITVFYYGCGTENPAGNNPIGNTDTSFVAYVIITPSGGSPDTLFFTDRNLCTGSYSSSQNNTYCLLNDTISGNSSSVTFAGGTTGNPAFTFGYISYNGNGLNATGISGSITLYEAGGGKIKGSFSGTYSDGTITYQVSSVFTVRRTQ